MESFSSAHGSPALVAHKLATTARGDPIETARLVGTLVNNFGDQLKGTTEERIGDIADMTLRTQQRFQISNLGVLGEGLSESSSIARTARLPLDELMAAIGFVNTAGKQGSEAGTAIASALENLPRASQNLGFQIERREDKSLDLVATLAGLERSLRGMGIDERQMALQKEFGQGMDALVPIMEKLADYGKAIGDVGEMARKQNVNDRDYARLVDTDRGRWESLKENVALVFQELAGANADVLEGPMAALTDYAARLGATLEENPALAKGAGTAVAAASAWTAASPSSNLASSLRHGRVGISNPALK